MLRIHRTCPEMCNYFKNVQVQNKSRIMSPPQPPFYVYAQNKETNHGFCSILRRPEVRQASPVGPLLSHQTSRIVSSLAPILLPLDVLKSTTMSKTTWIITEIWIIWVHREFSLLQPPFILFETSLCPGLPVPIFQLITLFAKNKRSTFISERESIPSNFK